MEEGLAAGRLGGSVTAGLYEETHLSDGRATGYGRGVFVGNYAGMREIHHDGGYAAFRAWLAHYPESRVSIALLCNTATPNIIALGREVTRLVLADRLEEQSSGSSTAVETEGAAPLVPHLLEEYPGVFISDKSGLPITISAEGARLKADGFKLEALGPSHFRVSWGDLIFDSSDLIRLIRRDGETIFLRRAAGPALSAAELAALEGRYHSDEALATYTVSIEEGRLVLQLVGRPSHVYILDPIARDLFAMRNIVVRFQRDAQGYVTSYEMTVPRIRRLTFYAQPID